MQGAREKKSLSTQHSALFQAIAFIPYTLTPLHPYTLAPLHPYTLTPLNPKS
ncbi:hypothetical protein [Nostoc sp. CMAA1605]|uniref:hypothetical protein n=1 Tax=Nostoc sp. CMAA1605 TaxID=2055159 RepID=UPI001F33EFE3|nr:hypothetical protein [Nostoc sp. CMAA1605]